MAHAAFTITLKDDLILLEKRAPGFEFAGSWGLPGGVVEDDVTFEVAAARETLEETGITCKITNFLESFEARENTIHVYFAEYISGTIAIDVEEVTDVQWFTYEQAMKLPLAFNTKQLLEAYVSAPSE